MASTIKQRTISAVVDNRVRLTNSNFARAWSSGLGTGWTTIRIACRAGIEDSGGNITSTPRWALGICAGTTNIFQDATCDHWLGIVSNTATITRAAGPPVIYNLGSAGSLVAARKVASASLSGSTSLSATANYMLDVTTANRSLWAVEITKGSPNFTLKMFSRNSTSSGDVDLATYLSQIELATMSLANHGYTGSVTVAIDEATNGFFTCAMAAWDHSSPAIELSDLAVVRLA